MYHREPTASRSTAVLLRRVYQYQVPGKQAAVGEACCCSVVDVRTVDVYQVLWYLVYDVHGTCFLCTFVLYDTVGAICDAGTSNID